MISEQEEQEFKHIYTKGRCLVCGLSYCVCGIDEKEINALNFYKRIEEKKDFFKIINGLFVVEQIGKDEFLLIGDFLKAKSPLNNTQRNKIKLISTKQIFYPAIKKRRNKNNILLKMGISWFSEPIGKILENESKRSYK